MKTTNSKLLILLLVLLTGFLNAQVGSGGDIPPDDAPMACHEDSPFWNQGGNVLGSSPSYLTEIGTCNNYPFILKANDVKTLYIKPGAVGINNASPGAVLDIRGSASNFKIFGDIDGKVESTTDMRLFYANTKGFYVNENNTGGVINRLNITGGNINLTGNTSITGSLGVSTLMSVGGNLLVNGATILNNNISITGASTLNGNLGVTGATSLNGNLGITGITTLNGNLGVVGTSNLSGNVSITGNSSITGLVDISTSLQHFKIYGDVDCNLESSNHLNISYASSKEFRINEGPAMGGTNRFIIKNDAIGINNTNPTGALDVRNHNVSNQSSFRIYGDVDGNLESTSDINMNFATNKIFKINEGPASGGVNIMTIIGGQVGIGSTAPIAKLEVTDASNTDICVNSTNLNGTAGLWALNGTTNYGLTIDNNGYGHIKQNMFSSNNLINFNFNTTHNKPQVWIGGHPTSGIHTNFNLATGKIVAQEIYVFVTGSWADYVFADNYKLRKLSDVELFYKKNHHLPEIPNAKEIEENGVNVAEMNKLLLQKVEELTIYLVELNKKVELLEKKNNIINMK